MPIKGLSDERRLPRAGKIHLGIKKTSAKGSLYPSATDYFVVNADQSTSEAAAQAFHAAYGDTPRALDILIPNLGDDLAAVKEIIFPQYYKQYGSGTGLKCKGDGVTAERMEVDTKTGAIERKQVDCAGPGACHYVRRMPDGSGGSKGDCGPIAHLQVLLPKVAYLGIWQIDTSSEISIRQINSDLDLIYMAAGRISNIPLKLQLAPRQVSPGGKKKTIHTLTIAYTGSIQQLRMLRPNQGAFLVDMVDDEEVPTDIRPPEALQPHPLAGRLAETGRPPEPQRQPERLEHFENAFGPEDDGTASEPLYTLEGPPPPPMDDPLEKNILFHAWRAGIAQATLGTLRRTHKTPEQLLTTLQKTPTPPARARQLAAMGYNPDGFIRDGDARPEAAQ
jgi:hypothetical protein